MVNINEIISCIEKISPKDIACDFDNVGLLVGRHNKEINKVLVCLDADHFIIEEAKEIGAELIITHHPVIFNPIKSVNDETMLGKALIDAIESKIAIYSAHTNLDNAENGLNDYFLEKIGLSSACSLEEGSGRLCILEKELTVKDLCEKIKKEFNLPYIKTTGDKDKKINKIALCTGAGSSLIDAAMSFGADVFISGDIKYNNVRDIYLSDMDLIEIGHYDSEIIVTSLIKRILEDEFNDKIEVIISKQNKNEFNVI